MRKACTVAPLAVLLALLTAVLTLVSSSASEEDNEKVVVEGNSRFALELYSELRKTEGNLFLSPYSISTALAMTYAGARGKTAEEMADVLHFGLEQKKLHPVFAALISDLNARGPKGGGYELSVANALWGQKGYAFLKEFVALLNESYDAGLNEVDFEGATEEARKTINSWVEKQTKEKIKDLIQPGVLNDLTRLVLTNAIYFKGKWASQFDEKKTKDEPFHVSVDRDVNVAMMQQKGDFRYGEAEGIQVLELPYVGKDLSMMVFLPREINGLPELEQRLTRENLNDWLQGLHECEVEVYLPRFKITAEFSLGEVLTSLGMVDAFKPRVADLSGMNGQHDLFISAVVHKAFVDVNEEGTEAAAATAVVVGLESVPEPPPVFRADHPFLFLLKDNLSGSILFIGRLVNPQE